jgi:ABC-type uncharacterized transport system permease subunit
MLGKITPEQLPRELLRQAGWIVVLLILNRVAFARGVRRYSSFGE